MAAGDAAYVDLRPVLSRAAGYHADREFLGLQRIPDHPRVHVQELCGDLRRLFFDDRCLRDLQYLLVDDQVLRNRLGGDAGDRFYDRLLPVVSRSFIRYADGVVPRLHDSVLDLERDPDDLVDTAARPQRAREPGAAVIAYDRQAA